MKNKKAAIETQFNWIFVMVAGALILVFFFGVVQKQRELSQQKISNSIMTNLESIATGAGVSKGTVQTVALPNIGINFGCTEECLCAYSIGDLNREYHDKVIFAPHFVKASEVVLWTLDWKVPFRATNLIYATTSKDKYYFVFSNPNSALYNMLNKTMPPEVNAQFVPFAQYTKLKYENHNSVKFIFIETSEPPQPDLGLDKSFRREDVSAVLLNSAGDAIFFEKIDPRELDFIRKESSYFGEPMIYGAVFAPDFDTYECSVISALKRLDLILDIYLQRTEALDNANNQKNFCSKGYSSTNIEDLKNAADTASKSTKSLKAISSAVSAVNSQNEDLLRGSCPLLY